MLHTSQVRHKTNVIFNKCDVNLKYFIFLPNKRMNCGDFRALFAV